MTPALPPKAKRLHLLDAADVAALYDRPIFTEEDRVVYFTLLPLELALMQTFSDPAVQAFFVLQLGYFKAKQRFFTVDLATVQDDLIFIGQHLDLGMASADLRLMGKRTLLTQRRLILERFGYRRPEAADRAQAFDVALQAARISPKPQYLLRMLLQHFTTQQCILPGYTTLQETIIGKALTAEEQRLTTILQTHLTAAEVAALAGLFDISDGRYRLTLLRRAPRTLSHSALRQERDRAAALLPLATVATRVLPILAISPEAITYYASLVGYYSAARLKGLETKMVQIYLLCFVQQRYQRVHDHLLSGVMHAVKDYWDAAKTAAKEQVYAYRTALTTDLVQAGRVLQLVADGLLPPTTPFSHVQSAAFGLLDRAALARTATYLVTGAGCDKTAFIWEHIDTLARRFKGRLRPLLKAIPLEASTATSPLLEAVHFLQDLATRGRPLSQVAAHTIPTQCLPVRLKRYLYAKATDGTPQLIRDRYEFYVYTALRAALESGDLVCPQSIRFRSLDDDLIPLDDWHAHRDALIADIESPILQQPIAEHLADLEQALEAQFAAVNGRIARGENPGITIKKHGKTQTWTLQTPKGRERPNHALFETLPQVTLNAVLAYVERECGYMSAFDHILGRGHHHTRDDRVLRACLIAWGTNLSLHRMGESCDLPTGWLIRASENYLRLETVQAATTIISNAIAALPLFRAYDLGGVIHSSSDGQKFATDHDTLKAQHSPKYYGLGKGVVSISLVASHIPLDARMVSAHDAESQWVFDLLYNNPTDIRPAIHSTDTHGTNHVNFALLKVFGVEFAPRYADLRAKIATGLYGAQHPSQYGADALFRPVRKLNTDLISREWDNLLRIFVSLARKTTTQSVLISKLSATKRRNRTLQALWEYDHLVASQYLLDYVDSETVRQHVQRALNRGEQYHQLKRALTQGNAGKLRFSNDEEQELWDACSRLLVNAILYYNIRMLSDAVALKEAHGDAAGAAFLKDVSPMAWHHINLHGQYAFGDEPDAVPLAHCVATMVQYHPADTPTPAEVTPVTEEPD